MSRMDQKRVSQLRKKTTKEKKAPLFLWVFLILCLFLFSVIVIPFLKGTTTNPNPEKVESFHGSKASDGSSNILLLGSDARPNETDASRSDTIMVLHLGRNPKLISIMRDTYVTIPNYGKNKINAAYALGKADLVRQTLLENFGIATNYYVKVNFETFEKVIDHLFPKGITIDAEKEIALDGVTILPKVQKMDGHTLLQYARFRKDEEGDFGRVRRQQQVLNAALKQLNSPFTLLHLGNAFGTALSYTSTNMSRSYLFGQVIKGLLFSKKEIQRLSIPVENSWSYGYYNDAGSVLEVNIDQNRQAIDEFLKEK